MHFLSILEVKQFLTELSFLILALIFRSIFRRHAELIDTLGKIGDFSQHKERTPDFMNPTLFAILIHFGTVKKTIMDVEKGIQDIIQGKATPEDAKAILNDFADVLETGLISIPNTTTEQMKAVIAAIRGAWDARQMQASIPPLPTA